MALTAIPDTCPNPKHPQVGGLLFLPLSWEIYDPERATRALRSFCECVRRQHADEEVVVLSEIFPHGQSLAALNGDGGRGMPPCDVVQLDNVRTAHELVLDAQRSTTAICPRA